MLWWHFSQKSAHTLTLHQEDSALRMNFLKSHESQNSDNISIRKRSKLSNLPNKI